MCRLSFRNLGGLMKIRGAGHMTTFVIPKQEARTFLATTAGGRQHVVGGRGKDLELERTGKEYLLLCCLKRVSGADFVHLWNGDTITYLKAAAGAWEMAQGSFWRGHIKIYFPMPFPMSTLYWLLKCTLERMRKECVSPEKRANKCLSSFLMGTHALEVRGNDRGTPHPAVQEGTPQRPVSLASGFLWAEVIEGPWTQEQILALPLLKEWLGLLPRVRTFTRNIREINLQPTVVQTFNYRKLGLTPLSTPLFIPSPSLKPQAPGQFPYFRMNILTQSQLLQNLHLHRLFKCIKQMSSILLISLMLDCLNSLRIT